MFRSLVIFLIVMLIGLMHIINVHADFDTWDDSNGRWRELHKAVCLKKQRYGNCKGHRKMWYFDMVKMKCSQFIYSNCGGNMNRFFHKDECDEFCTAYSKEWIR